MEELLAYALLYGVGYEKYAEKYQALLDSLFLHSPEDENLLDLEEKTMKDAMLHLYYRMNTYPFEVCALGKQLMLKLRPIYEETDIADFGKRMYRLWQLLPDTLKQKEPFHFLSYADDCLSYGDEDQCRKLYERALKYYE